MFEYGTLVKDLHHRLIFMTLPDGKLKAVYKKGDKFCDAKKVKGKKTFTPIESQPENVIELVRNYSVLKKDATYRRRVSWLGIGARESIALVEYFGKFPGLSQHGNGKEGTEYIRTPASVMTEMSDMLHNSEYQKPHGQIKLRKRDSVISDDSEILCRRTNSQLPQQMEKWR